MSAEDWARRRWPSAHDYPEQEAAEEGYRAGAAATDAVLQAIYAEGLTNHNTRCKPWWTEVLRALGKLET